MENISLKRDYVAIYNEDNRTTSFGGNQSWFSGNPWHNVSHQGCGLISAVDAALYISNQTHISHFAYTNLISDFIHFFPSSKIFMHEFFRAHLSVGILPRQICSYIKKATNNEVRARWNGIHGHKHFIEKVTKQLDQDLPVVWGLYSMGKELTLYTLYEATGQYKAATTVNSHYVNAVGVTFSPEYRKYTDQIRKNDIMIEVSSWGRKYYVDYREYLDFIGDSLIAKYASNIVILTRN
ncbi:MAG: hypothetical protein K6F66_01060 [Pseudobutyrivibrio sp.]|nr:hypothetical protein [Pseudobutyrivibrio sp.]